MSASTSEPNNLLISINPNLTTSELVNGSMPGEHLSNQVTWWHAMESQTYKLEMSCCRHMVGAKGEKLLRHKFYYRLKL